MLQNRLIHIFFGNQNSNKSSLCAQNIAYCVFHLKLNDVIWTISHLFHHLIFPRLPLMRKIHRLQTSHNHFEHERAEPFSDYEFRSRVLLDVLWPNKLKIILSFPQLNQVLGASAAVLKFLFTFFHILFSCISNKKTCVSHSSDP